MSANSPGKERPADRVSILVVDDDAEVRLLLVRYLGRHGFEVVTAANAMQSRETVASAAIDLVLLDLGLPDEDGLTHLRHLQSTWRGPVIVLTGRGEAVERVVGLELGADDYVTKPFDFRELVARIRSVLRRTGTRAVPAAEHAAAALVFAGFTLYPASRRLLAPDGQDIELTAGEFNLLQALLAQPGCVLSRDQLMSRLHGREPGPYDRAIDMQVARLRRKLGDDPAQPPLIRSVRGAGYLLATEVRRT